eukprot:6176410-Pleurochrysis_carterae.AAC.1
MSRTSAAPAWPAYGASRPAVRTPPRRRAERGGARPNTREGGEGRWRGRLWSERDRACERAREGEKGQETAKARGRRAGERRRRRRQEERGGRGEGAEGEDGFGLWENKDHLMAKENARVVC